MSAEEADKTGTTDASPGDEEEEWLYGGKLKQKKKHFTVCVVHYTVVHRVTKRCKCLELFC